MLSIKSGYWLSLFISRPFLNRKNASEREGMENNLVIQRQSAQRQFSGCHAKPRLSENYRHDLFSCKSKWELFN